MARMSGLVGGLSGKMGNAVFRQRNGQQIVAQYQPVVRNPRSENQSFQRARFKLMSQLAAVVADGLGGTMSILARPERGASPRNNFVKVNFNLSEANLLGDDVKATIDLTQVQLTNSVKPLGSLTLDTTQGDAMVKAAITNIPNNVTKVRIMAIGTVADNDNNVPVQIHLQTYNVVAGEVTADIQIPAFADAKKAVVLAYGIIPLTSEASQRLQNIALDSNEIGLLLSNIYRDGSSAETTTIAAEAVWQG